MNTFPKFLKKVEHIPTRDAIISLRQADPKWRKRWGETYKEHMRHRPSFINIRTWRYWYVFPFGNPLLNAKSQLVRRWLWSKKPRISPRLYEGHGLFTVQSAAMVLGVTGGDVADTHQQKQKAAGEVVRKFMQLGKET